MTALAERKAQLPDKIEDLAKFVLIGREKLTAVRAEIRAIDRVGLAKEVHEQKLAEAQDLAEAVLDAEMKIGELTMKLDKSSGGDRRSDDFKKDSGVHFEKTDTELREKDTAVPKQKQLENIGITEKQKQRFEKLARHPQAVESAKVIAREEGRVVSRQDVLDLIVDPPESKPLTQQANIRKIDRDHMGFLLEKKLNPVVDIAAAQKDRENAEAIAYNNHTRILKVLKEIGKMQFYMEDADIDRMAATIGTDATKRLLRSMKVEMEYLLTIYNRLVEITK